LRCLHCRRDGIPITTELCPQCGVHLPSLLRDVLPGGVLLRSGAYRLDFALGRGGFGITYRAVHVALEQLVAIKEFYPQDYAMRAGASESLRPLASLEQTYRRSLERFVIEGRILASLSHPNVVRVQDLFEDRGTAYLVMELVPGQTLREELDAQPDKRMSVERVWAVLEQAVAALEVVHQAGVLHLDLKPDNILVTPEKRVVLIDFGAARRGLGGKSTRVFTMEYAAPEVLTGEDVGPESDIFELGMVIHELLMGQRPPPALSRLIQDTWEPQGLREPWDRILAAALQLQRSNRPTNVRTLLDIGKKGSAARLTPPAIPAVPAAPEAQRDTRGALAAPLPKRVNGVDVPVLIVSKERQARFKNIGDAIRIAQPGTRIVVRPGVYNERLVIDKPVEIIGDGSVADIIVETSNSNCIQMRTHYALVQGLTLRGLIRVAGDKFFTVDIPRGQLVLEDCDITSNTLACVAIYGASATPIIRRCTIHHSSAGGVSAWDNSTGLIEDCDIFGNTLAGVEVRKAANPTFRRCVIHNGQASGVLITQDGHGQLEACEITDNAQAGIEIKQRGYPLVRDCKINRNGGHGIWVYEKGAGQIEHCDLTGNNRGPWSIDMGCSLVRTENRE
jgi:F-box protein 11